MVNTEGYFGQIVRDGNGNAVEPMECLVVLLPNGYLCVVIAAWFTSWFIEQFYESLQDGTFIVQIVTKRREDVEIDSTLVNIYYEENLVNPKYSILAVNGKVLYGTPAANINELEHED